MSRILKTLDEGRTTMQYKGKKNVPIDKGMIEGILKTQELVREIES